MRPSATAEAAVKQDYQRLAERRPKNVARATLARKLLVLVYYALRDGQVRCLAQAQKAG